MSNVDAADAVSCDVDGAFHRIRGERLRGNHFSRAQWRAKRARRREESEREEHLRSGQGGSE